MSLNMEKQLLFYGSFHHHPVNIAIHLICVPILLTTAIQFATNTPSLIPLPSYLTIPHLPPNLGTLIAVLYSTLYILMEPVAGSLLAPLILSGAALANHMTTTFGSTATKYSLILHITSWMGQFMGHGVFERRAPALTQNLTQAVFLAPFFVWMELLFWAGYRPELRSRLQKMVLARIDALNKAKAADVPAAKTS